MPDQQNLDSYNFEGNPFEALLGGGGAPAQNGAPQGGIPQGVASAPTPAPEQAAQSALAAATAGQQAQVGGQVPAGGPGVPEPSQFDKDVSTGGTRPLLGAVQQLENFIKGSTDRDAIMTSRAIIALLTKLIARDQEELAKE